MHLHSNCCNSNSHPIHDLINRATEHEAEHPLAILDRRLAQGDLTIEDYQQRKSVLHGH